MSDTTRYTVIPRTLIFVLKDEKVLLLKYSGRGEHMTQEKLDRRDIYNGLGGHIEANEDIITSAIKEVREEAGITLEQPKIKGVLNVSNFARNNCMVFLVTGTTSDAIAKQTLEGQPEWVDRSNLENIPTFPDLKPILEKLFQLKDDQMLIGTSQFDGKFGLLSIDLNIC